MSVKPLKTTVSHHLSDVFQSRQTAGEGHQVRAGEEEGEHRKDRQTSDGPYLLFYERVDSLKHPFTRELIRHIRLNLQKQQGTVKGDTGHEALTDSPLTHTDAHP